MKKEEMASEGYEVAQGLDLSKIKSIGSYKQIVSEEFAEKIETTNKKAKIFKFCFTEEHDIEIPMGGFLYQDEEDKDIRSGIVRLQPMPLIDEKILSTRVILKMEAFFVTCLTIA